MARARPLGSPPAASPDEIEQQFYDALQRADIDRLMAVWADDDEISCVHPGGPRLVGPLAIRTAFEAIFANGAVDARAEQIHRLHTHGCAVHSVVEHVRLVGGAGQEAGDQTGAEPSDRAGQRSAWVIATNVYLLTSGGWRMVSHHASPGAQRPAPDVDEPAIVLH